MDVGRTHTIVRLQTRTRRKDGTENIGGFAYVLDRFLQRDFVLWVFLCWINVGGRDNRTVPKFQIFILDLCVGTAPQNLGTTPQVIGDHSLSTSRPLVILHLRGSRPGNPWFLLFVCFVFVLSFIIIPRTVYLSSDRFFKNILSVLFFVYMPAPLCSVYICQQHYNCVVLSLFAFCYDTYIPGQQRPITPAIVSSL